MTGMSDKLTPYGRGIFGVDISGGGLDEIQHANKIVLVGLTAEYDEATKTATLTGAAEGSAEPVRLTIETETGTARTVAAADEYKLVRCSNAAGCSVTIPPNASVEIPVGATCYWEATVADQQVTLVAGSGVTLTTATTLLSRDQHSVIWATKVDTDEWLIGGDLQPL